jgi:hypothetical protein
MVPAQGMIRQTGISERLMLKSDSSPVWDGPLVTALHTLGTRGQVPEQEPPSTKHGKSSAESLLSVRQWSSEAVDAVRRASNE